VGEYFLHLLLVVISCCSILYLGSDRDMVRTGNGPERIARVGLRPPGFPELTSSFHAILQAYLAQFSGWRGVAERPVVATFSKFEKKRFVLWSQAICRAICGNLVSLRATSVWMYARHIHGH